MIETRLTREIAKQWLADHAAGVPVFQDTLDLGEFTVIDDDAAEEFRNISGPFTFDGLTQLSDVAAESLAQVRSGLYLNGLTSLSDTAADILSGSEHSQRLHLDGLISLSDAAAESLSIYDGYLHLNGLTSLSDAAAESLGTHKYWLSLNGLTGLSDAAAESLAKHTAHLSVNGLPPSATPQLARTRAKNSVPKHKGGNRTQTRRKSPFGKVAPYLFLVFYLVGGPLIVNACGVPYREAFTCATVGPIFILVCAAIVWSQMSDDKQAAKRTQTQKRCPVCNHAVWTKATSCPNCNYQW